MTSDERLAEALGLLPPPDPLTDFQLPTLADARRSIEATKRRTSLNALAPQATPGAHMKTTQDERIAGDLDAAESKLQGLMSRYGSTLGRYPGDF